MGLFKRVSDNIRANVNSLLDKAEDPEKMLDQYLRDMEEDIADAEGAVARQLAVAWKFKAQMDDALALVEKREVQALEALKSGREDLARRALEDKKLNMAKAEDYRSQYEDCNTTADQLKNQLQEMKNEYGKLRVKRDSLTARLQTARAQKGINEIKGGFNTNSARWNFDRMEDRVLQMEAEAKATEELSGQTKSLDEELESLGNNNDIDQELAKLKEALMRENE